MIVPGEVPGAKTPPALTVTVPPIEPVPLSVPPLLTTAPPAIEPVTLTVPALTVVSPLYVLAPASVSWPVPTFVSAPPQDIR